MKLMVSIEKTVPERITLKQHEKPNQIILK